MRALLLTVIILLLQLPVFASSKIDSLTAVLETTMADTQRVKTLNGLCWEYCYTDPEKGIQYGTEALELAQKIDFRMGIAKAYFLRGGCRITAMKLPEALDDCFNAIKHYEQLNYTHYLAGCNSNIGGIYYYQRKFDKALEYYNKAYEMEHRNDPGSSFEVAIVSNMGSILYDRKDYKRALEKLLLAVELCLKNGMEENLVGPYNIISIIQIANKDYKQALEYADKALPLAIKYKNEIEVSVNYRTRANILLELAKSDLLPSKYQGNKKEALTDARQYLDSTVAINTRLKITNQLVESYAALVNLEEYKGNFKEALEYHRLFKQFSDTLNSDENKERILQTSMQYDFDKKEALAGAIHDAEIRKQKVIRNSVAAGFAIVLVFSALVFRQRNRIRKEKKRSEDLLLNILPEEVAEELKEKGNADAKQIDEVTVLFTDFRNFTLLAEQMSPQQLVNEIHYCYSAFDRIIQKHSIEKIKTIGDSYMCAGGVPVSNTTHAIDVVSAALEIRDFMASEKLKREAEGHRFFEIRIGCHTGPVVAGIVGIKKFAYDIWGDTVNIASRMESSGEPGMVNISGSTYEKVKHRFQCEHRGKIAAKNKGMTDMYFVTGRISGLAG